MASFLSGALVLYRVSSTVRTTPVLYAQYSKISRKEGQMAKGKRQSAKSAIAKGMPPYLHAIVAVLAAVAYFFVARFVDSAGLLPGWAGAVSSSNIGGRTDVIAETKIRQLRAAKSNADKADYWSNTMSLAIKLYQFRRMDEALAELEGKV